MDTASIRSELRNLRKTIETAELQLHRVNNLILAIHPYISVNLTRERRLIISQIRMIKVIIEHYKKDLETLSRA